ncbi:hypothetical protein A0H81_08417 [Grifola frondosa]|uniref:Pet127-domain-containing protein n=1 Tax=Grifola frondosa TaxID=5627 RepID=A0A1C7M2T4_GRIFR|nr:hypothetical protein A0H81_08417 [Grifola frondosa]
MRPSCRLSRRILRQPKDFTTHSILRRPLTSASGEHAAEPSETKPDFVQNLDSLLHSAEQITANSSTSAGLVPQHSGRDDPESPISLLEEELESPDEAKQATLNANPKSKKKKKEKKDNSKDKIIKKILPPVRMPKNKVILDELSEELPQKKTAKRKYKATEPFKYTYKVEGWLLQSQRHILKDLKPLSEQSPIPTLKNGLNRVLFNPGVHWMKDPRTSVYNFPKRMEKIPKVEDFAFDRVTGFIPSSQDNDLWALAKREKCKFTGSTSSLTGLLSQIYLSLSGEKLVNLGSLSRSFKHAPRGFTPGQRMPVSVMLKYRDGVYSTDSDSSYRGIHQEIILTWMCGQFVTRSQLDCVEHRLPGTGIFDLKTRAAVPIRYDVYNYANYTDYKIRHLTGEKESFEKEYYDLIRSAFLKYSFQVRIGNMDGVLVAYHNTAEIFGFQYIPLADMEARLYGSADAGDRVFEKCIGLLEIITKEVTECFPERTVRCTWETRKFGMMHVWVEPEEWPEDEEKPIVQLNVEFFNFTSGERISGHHIVRSVRYVIGRANLDYAEIRRRRQFAFNRQLMIARLPSGEVFNEISEHGEYIDTAVLEKLAVEPKKPFFPPATPPAGSQPSASYPDLNDAESAHEQATAIEAEATPEGTTLSQVEAETVEGKTTSETEATLAETALETSTDASDTVREDSSTETIIKTKIDEAAPEEATVVQVETVQEAASTNGSEAGQVHDVGTSASEPSTSGSAEAVAADKSHSSEKTDDSLSSNISPAEEDTSPRSKQG